MEHADLPAEVGGKDPQQLGGEGDLRHQYQGGPAPGQGLLDQAEVHLCLAAAGDAVQQSGSRPGAAHGLQSLEGPFLLLVEADGPRRLYLVQGDPAEHLLTLQGEHSAFLQGTQGLHRGSGEVAQLLGRGGAQLAQQLGDRKTKRRRPAPGSDQSHGLLRRHGQHRQFFHLIPHAPLGAGHTLRRPPLQQAPDGRLRVFGAEGGTDLLHIPPAAQGQQQLSQLPGGGRALCRLIDRRAVRPLFQDDPVPKGEIQPRGEHGLHRVIDGAEIPFPHPEGQPDGRPVQHRLRVQGSGDGLEPLCPVRPLPEGQHQAV